MQFPNIAESLDRRRAIGRVSTATLARWALVRQIADLEEALADCYHCADPETAPAFMETTRGALARKRAALRAM